MENDSTLIIRNKCETSDKILQINIRILFKLQVKYFCSASRICSSSKNARQYKHRNTVFCLCSIHPKNQSQFYSDKSNLNNINFKCRLKKKKKRWLLFCTFVTVQRKCRHWEHAQLSIWRKTSSTTTKVTKKKCIHS